MARYCSVQDNVRTRQSPPYRETIRVNVLHGRKSMSWAKSVLPLFTGTSSETFRKVPDRVQIDTTLNRQNRVQNHPFIGRHRLLNRTAVILDMKQPGVTVQPLRQMNGYASFNQVFLTDARVEPEFLVSEIGDGWAVTTTTLMHERRGDDGLRSWAIASDKPGCAYDEEREEIRTTMEPYKWYPQRAGRVDLILERARATGKVNDPVLRQEIAKVLVMSKAAEWTARRARTAQEQGRPQGPEGSLGKLASSLIARAAARVHTSLLGPDALLTGDDSPMNGLL